MKDREIERQDFVDNAIYRLIKEVNPSSKPIAWDIDFIAEIRDIVSDRFLKLGICTERDFYPYQDE